MLSLAGSIGNFHILLLQTHAKIILASSLTYVFRPFIWYLVEAPLAVITASSRLGCDATCFAQLDLGIFHHSSLQILSSSVRWDGDS